MLFTNSILDQRAKLYYIDKNCIILYYMGKECAAVPRPVIVRGNYIVTR